MFFTKLTNVGSLVAIACTPDGSIVAVNNSDGRVLFYAVDSQAVDQQLRPLPLRFTPADASGVLLHPDGRVISYRYDGALIIRIHDPCSGAQLREFVPELGERDEPELDDDEAADLGDHPSVADGYHFDVALLSRPPPLDWLLPLEIANPRVDGPIDWMSGLPEELRHGDMYPNRFTRMALHPNRRWLAVIDRATWIVDLDTGELVSTLDYAIDEASLFEYGEGTHTIGFDDRGLLAIASVAISGNPFLQVDRLDVETGALETTTENWRQSWAEPDAGEIEVHVYDPTTHLPPERILADTYMILFRRRAIELWSRAGLHRSVAVAGQTCVIPGFDPASFCAEPRVLLVSNDQLELLELATGERSARHPPIGEPTQTARLTHIGFDSSRRRVLLWREHAALLAAPIGEDRWAVCELPEPRRMRDWAFADASGRAFAVDDAGDLWLGSVDPEPAPTPTPRPSLQDLERELLAQPHEAAPFLVYADALTERGDPRGELIILQHQRAFDDAFALLERNPDALIGPLAQVAPASFELNWERGYVRAAQFRIVYDELDRVLGFLASEPARLLEFIDLQVEPRSEVDDVPAIYASIDAYLAAARHLPLLRTLKLGRPGEHTLSATLRAALPQLLA